MLDLIESHTAYPLAQIIVISTAITNACPIDVTLVNHGNGQSAGHRGIVVGIAVIDDRIRLAYTFTQPLFQDGICGWRWVRNTQRGQLSTREGDCRSER